MAKLVVIMSLLNDLTISDTGKMHAQADIIAKLSSLKTAF